MAQSEVIDTLRRLRRQRRLIPFVGAGLSQQLKLPSWSKLVDFIAEQLDYDPEVFRLNGTYPQLAEYYAAQKQSIGPLRSEMDRLFNPPDDVIAASRTHELLIKLKLPVIYTTNYDRIIERAYKLHGESCHTIAGIDDIGSAASDVTQVVKFHGTFDDDASLVLTESNYFDRLAFESPLDIKLRADMLGKAILFLGYSLSRDDVNIRYLLYKLHKLRRQLRKDTPSEPSAYLTAYGAGEVQQRLLSRWDVEVIELDPIDKTGSTVAFLESLT